MTALTTNPSVQALAWTLVHFLWQGAAIGAVVFLFFRVARPTAQARYAGGIVALAALVAAPLGTFAVLATTPAVPSARMAAAPRPTAPPGAAAESVALPLPSPSDAPATAAPAPAPTIEEVAAVAIVAAWGIGVLLLSCRLAGGWLLARRLARRGAPPASPEIRETAGALARRLGLTRAVRIVESTAVSVPVLIGWFKPVVVWPTAALSGLSAAQLEALIAHELAHVRRHDYVVNLLQSAAETLLFYHPAVWFVSQEVREAREQCCDDLAIGVCDRVVYVSALADLAAISRAPRIALAATGGSLLRRVRRLVGQPQEHGAPGMAWLGMLALTLAIGGIAPAALGPSASAQDSGVEDDRAASDVPDVGETDAGAAPAGRQETAPARQTVPSPKEQPARADETRRLREAEEAYKELKTLAEQMQRQIERGQETPAEVRELRARLADLERQVAASPRAPREWPASGGAQGGEPQSTAHLQARAALARSEVDAARTELERARRLFDVGLLSESAIRDLQARVASGQRELAALAVEIRAVLEESVMRESLEQRRATLQTEGRVRQMEAELGAARQNLESVKRRYEVGVTGNADLAEAQSRMLAAEQRLVTARGELGLTQELRALRRQRTEALNRLAGELEATTRGSSVEPGQAVEGTTVVSDPDAQTRPGDVLAVEIAGEPALPRHYQVEANGTIRLPLVGSIPVAGLTAAQVREAVTDALRQRQLAPGRAVTVTLRRPR